MNRACIIALLALAGCAEDTPLLDVQRALAVGARQGCVIDDADRLRCWGELIWPVSLEWEGSEGLEYAISPVDVPGGVADVSVGFGSVCALARDGVIACWGTDDHELDFVDRDARSGALVADVGDPFVDVAAGSAHVCGATQGGDVWCWGDNDRGQLGQGHTDELDGDPPSTLGAIALPSPAVEIAAGGGRSCARTQDGDVYCWGNGDPSPTLVELESAAVQISAGNDHACAVDDRGALRCWGRATLASPGRYDEPFAQLGPTLVPFDRPVVQVSAGRYHGCARLSDGDAYCWGKNDVGQLGRGPVADVGDDEDLTAQPPIDAGGAIASIVAAESRTCALLQGGDVRCWGHTERWDGTTDSDCMVEMPNPYAGAICEPDTIQGFSCSAGARCCLGDDETPASARPVPL